MGHLRRVIILACIVISFAGCSDGDQQDTPEKLTFEVVDSLLGPVCAIESSGISFRPPANCISAPDSIQTALRQSLSLGASEGQTVEFQDCYVDLEHMTGVIVCCVSGINTAADTTRFLLDYRETLTRQFGEAQLMAGDYSVGGVRIHSFLVTTPQMVQFKLLCFGAGSSVAELSFFSVASAYESFVRRIESSIGSIGILEGGDVS